ncbi:phosphotransferase [Kineosporiaceae bacterium SCSIO 59966]|nr:phosphotransferase [Kineosporiaceae bacterium SCSIO 59966]
MSGRTFTKRRADAPPGFFAVEAAGLRWLAEAGGVPVPRPVSVGPDHIELPYLDPAPPTATAAEALGRGLARTHAAGAPAFGSPPADWAGDGFIGPLPLAHRPSASWGAFYADLRVEPFARRAHTLGSLTDRALDAVLAVCDRLRSGELDDGRPPARLHGDLWSGNVIWTADGAVLVDPAAHGGHPETDLAMLQLFGLPHLDRVLAAYDEAAPLTDGWRERVGLHQLHPLLVHAVLFGPSYGAAAERAALSVP